MAIQKIDISNLYSVIGVHDVIGKNFSEQNNSWYDDNNQWHRARWRNDDEPAIDAEELSRIEDGIQAALEVLSDTVLPNLFTYESTPLIESGVVIGSIKQLCGEAVTDIKIPAVKTTTIKGKLVEDKNCFQFDITKIINSGVNFNPTSDEYKIYCMGLLLTSGIDYESVKTDENQPSHINVILTDELSNYLNNIENLNAELVIVHYDKGTAATEVIK